MFGVSGCGSRVSGFGFLVSGFGFRVSGFGILGFGSWVLGLGFRVLTRTPMDTSSPDSPDMISLSRSLPPLSLTHTFPLSMSRSLSLAAWGLLNLRTTTSQECEAVPRRARI